VSADVIFSPRAPHSLSPPIRGALMLLFPGNIVWTEEYGARRALAAMTEPIDSTAAEITVGQ